MTQNLTGYHDEAHNRRKKQAETDTYGYRTSDLYRRGGSENPRHLPCSCLPEGGAPYRPDRRPPACSEGRARQDAGHESVRPFRMLDPYPNEGAAARGDYANIGEAE